MASFVSNFSVEDVQLHMKKLATFIGPHQSLVDAYLSEYFTKEIWNRVKEKWWETLLMEESENLATLLSPKTFKTRTVWPLSLLAHRRAAHALALDRGPLKLTYSQVKQILRPSSPEKGLNRSSDARRSSENDSDLNISCDARCEIKDGQYRPLEHCYRRHVKPKKQHEISTLAEVIDEACTCMDISNVVDVGAGQGHLSRLLTYGYHKKVTTVEAEGHHIPKAQKFDSEVQRDIALGRTQLTGKMLKKNRKNNSSNAETEKSANKHEESEVTANAQSSNAQPSHTVAWISEDLDWKQFVNIIDKSNIQSNFNDQSSNVCNQQHIASGTDSNKEKFCERCDSSCNSCDTSCDSSSASAARDAPKTFLVTGLHACGDLSPTMMRVFVKCPQAQCLASVSCCYMKLTTSSNRNGCSEAGYPMSSFARDHLKCPLSYEAREMACHFIDAYHQRLLDNPPGLKSHVNRAALQEIVIAKSPNKVHDSVKLTFKKSHQLSFLEYAKKALDKMDLDNYITEQQLQTAQDKLEHWKDVVAFYTLRLSLAPAIESLILLDRLLYVLENGMNAALVPLFDPQLSPRNFSILAGKPNDHQTECIPPQANDTT